MFITIVELPEYIKDSKRLLDEESQDAIKDYLSVNPKAGELIKGTGGSEEAAYSGETCHPFRLKPATFLFL
jgi:hypothetical protein